MKYYIYILYSIDFDKYYVGYSEDPEKRLFEHNHPIHAKFTSKYIPWELKSYFFVSENKADVIRVERCIKKI